MRPYGTPAANATLVGRKQALVATLPSHLVINFSLLIEGDFSPEREFPEFLPETGILVGSV